MASRRQHQRATKCLVQRSRSVATAVVGDFGPASVVLEPACQMLGRFRLPLGDWQARPRDSASVKEARGVARDAWPARKYRPVVPSRRSPSRSPPGPPQHDRPPSGAVTLTVPVSQVVKPSLAATPTSMDSPRDVGDNPMHRPCRSRSPSDLPLPVPDEHPSRCQDELRVLAGTIMLLAQKGSHHCRGARRTRQCCFT